MARYLKHEPRRSGYYFQRAVPKPLQHALGKVWKAKAGNTLTEANREALRLLMVTDNIIDIYRRDQRVVRFQDVVRADTYAISDLGDNDIIDTYDILDEEFTRKQEHEEIIRSWECLLEKITSMANPSASTLRGWRSELKLFTKHSRCKSFDAVTHEIVEDYVLVLKDACGSQASLRTKFGRLNSLNKYAQAYKFTNELYFDPLKLKGVKVNQGPRGRLEDEKCLDISAADEYFSLDKLGKVSVKFNQYIRTHWIMRWTIGHVGEVEGLMWEDIDMDARTLTFQANELRELKTDQRARKLPMTEPLYQLLKDMPMSRTGSIFKLKPTLDWGNAIRKHYRKLDGDLTPKSCRHYGSGIIQSKHGDVDRRVKLIHGHGKKGVTSTSEYGDIDTASLLPYLELLT
nr:hypothetical protein 1 [bacterium]